MMGKSVIITIVLIFAFIIACVLLFLGIASTTLAAFYIITSIIFLLYFLYKCIKYVIIKFALLSKIYARISAIFIVSGLLAGLFFSKSYWIPYLFNTPYCIINSYCKDIVDISMVENQNPEDVSPDEKKYIKKEYVDSASYSYDVVNTISGIITPILSLLAVVAAFCTLYRQRRQNELVGFENHLFQMIDQQHKLEEKVIDKHGSFRELYEQFCDIYKEVLTEKAQDMSIEDMIKITNYIFYFGADKNFSCDGTGKDLRIASSVLNTLNEKKIIRSIKDKEIDIFHNQKSEELGIYYRNLFNAIRYIDHKCPIDDKNKKKEYAKLVRTQISDFGQLMLYFNMQGKRGEAWIDGTKKEIINPKGDYTIKNKDNKTIVVTDCLLTRYLPIKNCAISILNKDIDPRNDIREEERKKLFSDDVIDYELKV